MLQEVPDVAVFTASTPYRRSIVPCSIKSPTVSRDAALTCDNGNIVFTKQIEYTDFPLDQITLWFAHTMSAGLAFGFHKTASLLSAMR